ncbi:hypothetical protein ACUTAF_05160 [Pseudomonas sp. SP16.1]|uniref:hypothetical protein n=1 Tax=Pseudomonas sp. SP16.1 TaxID=3458854 RepID=UPI004045B960
MRSVGFIIALSIFATNASTTEWFGEWATGETEAGTYLYAATVNDSGNLLGQYCSPSDGKCIWLLGMASACKEGDHYPILANSDVGARHIYVYCSERRNNNLYNYVFTDFDAIQEIVTKGIIVGFAVPLQSDKFRVIRFDLAGSNRAILSMQAAVEKAQRAAPSKDSGTEDFEL